VTAFWITYVAFVAIIAARYLAIAGLFHWLLWHRPDEKVRAERLAKQRPEHRAIRHEILMSLLSSFIYALPAAIAIEIWKGGGTAIYSSVDSLWGWIYIPVSMFIYFAANDTFFYWTHRAMHHPRLYSVMHRTHHKSKQPTPWAAFSFHPTEAALEAWLLPVMTLFVPIHISAALAVLMLMTLTSVLNHAGWEVMPRGWMRGWGGRHIITATHHNMHHTRFKGNYGLHFRFWDKLMNTDIMVQPELSK